MTTRATIAALGYWFKKKKCEHCWHPKRLSNRQCCFCGREEYKVAIAEPGHGRYQSDSPLTTWAEYDPSF